MRAADPPPASGYLSHDRYTVIGTLNNIVGGVGEGMMTSYSPAFKARVVQRLVGPRLQRAQPAIRLRSPIAIELPHLPHFANLIEIQHRRNQFVLVT